MPRESAKYLHDIREAAAKVVEFTAGCDRDRYLAADLIRSAVERQLEIIGEALAQLARRDPATAGRISEHARIIAFRNILIHGYADVDSRIVWDIVTTKVVTLQHEVDALLRELGV
jgi:uncharacterized protein with HEPN domain